MWKDDKGVPLGRVFGVPIVQGWDYPIEALPPVVVGNWRYPLDAKIPKKPIVYTVLKYEDKYILCMKDSIGFYTYYHKQTNLFTGLGQHAMKERTFNSRRETISRLKSMIKNLKCLNNKEIGGRTEYVVQDATNNR